MLDIPFISLWKDLMIFNSFGGHPILCSIVKKPFLLIMPKALVRSTKAMQSGYFCSWYFSFCEKNHIDN